MAPHPMLATDTLFAVPRGQWRPRSCPVCRGALGLAVPKGTVTYAMQRQRWVKIGRSHQVEVRRKVLSMPSPGCRVTAPAGMDWSAPIVLLGTVEGDVEHELHEAFAADHAAGEWFLPGVVMRRWLRCLSASQPALCAPVGPARPGRGAAPVLGQPGAATGPSR